MKVSWKYNARGKGRVKHAFTESVSYISLCGNRFFWSNCDLRDDEEGLSSRLECRNCSKQVKDSPIYVETRAVHPSRSPQVAR